MKTPTHLLLGHVLARNLPGSSPQKVAWVMAGAALPDAPLFVVGLFSWLQTICEYVGLSFVARMDSFYFDSAGFIALHHVLHSPTSLALLFCCWLVLQRHSRTGFHALWFLCGAASHSIVDIFTHAEDGILVLWPLNWSFRFNSGLDQWNMQGAGLWLAAIEATFVVGYGGMLLWKTANRFGLPTAYRKSDEQAVRSTSKLASLHAPSSTPKFEIFLRAGCRPLPALAGWFRSLCWCDARSEYQRHWLRRI